jgi:hypothetical protein
MSLFGRLACGPTLVLSGCFLSLFATPMLNRPSSNRRFFRGASRPSSRPFTSRPTTDQSRPDTSRPTTGQSRPWTAQTRPGTARPTTAASVRQDGSHVIALLEGRGIAREVGMAALDRETGRVMLVQVNSSLIYLFDTALNVFTARGLPNICKDSSPNAPSPAGPGPRPRHLSFTFGWLTTIHACRIYIRRVPWSTRRAYWEKILERNRRYVAPIPSSHTEAE